MTTIINETPEQKAERIGVPLIPKTIPIKTMPSNPHGAIGVCGQCGIELHRVMGYVCPQSNCPTGLGSKTSMQANVIC